MPWVGIRTHNPSVRVGEDSSCLRPRGHCADVWKGLGYKFREILFVQQGGACVVGG
jgi:hypothetical protein